MTLCSAHAAHLSCVAKRMPAMKWLAAAWANVQLQAIVHAAHSFDGKSRCHQIEEAASEVGADLPVSC